MYSNKHLADQPLIPARSILACSWMPMPLRIIRRLPSLYAPEHVTNCETPYTRYNRLSNRLLSNPLYNRFDNRLYHVNKHPTGCQTGLTTGWMFVYTIQPVVKPVWQPCWTNSHCSLNRTGCQTGLYNRIDNRLYTQHSHLSNRFDNQLNVCIHDTTSCETGLTTGCIVETGLKGIHTTYSSRSSAITHRSIAKIHVKDAVENFVGVSNCTFDILVPHNNSAMLWRHLHNTTTTTILRPFVRDHPSEPVPEETLTHPPSWSSSNLYQLLPSTTIHSILLVQITCLAIFLHNLVPWPLWSTDS